MAKDRVFDADLVIDPREALLQQGYIWTVSNVFTVPKNGTRLLSWQVGSGATATFDFRALATDVLVGDLITINSFSAGTELEAINRNFAFAPTAEAPLTKVYLDVVAETFTGSGSPDVLFTPNTRLPFPSLIVPGPIHTGMIFNNLTNKDTAINVVVLWHEEPQHKFPAGDPGP